jgi:hypothetical protein
MSYRSDTFSLDEKVRKLEEKIQKLKEKKESPKEYKRTIRERAIGWYMEHESATFTVFIASSVVLLISIALIGVWSDKKKDEAREAQREAEILYRERAKDACKHDFDCEVLHCRDNNKGCLVRSNDEYLETFDVNCSDECCWMECPTSGLKSGMVTSCGSKWNRNQWEKKYDRYGSAMRPAEDTDD